jgi:hypothetical protein
VVLFLALKGKYRLRVYVNRVLKIIFGNEREEVARG